MLHINLKIYHFLHSQKTCISWIWLCRNQLLLYWRIQESTILSSCYWFSISLVQMHTSNEVKHPECVCVCVRKPRWWYVCITRLVTCGLSMSEHSNSVTWWDGATQHRRTPSPLLTLGVERAASRQKHPEGSRNKGAALRHCHVRANTGTPGATARVLQLSWKPGETGLFDLNLQQVSEWHTGCSEVIM